MAQIAVYKFVEQKPIRFQQTNAYPKLAIKKTNPSIDIIDEGSMAKPNPPQQTASKIENINMRGIIALETINIIPKLQQAIIIAYTPLIQNNLIRI